VVGLLLSSATAGPSCSSSGSDDALLFVSGSAVFACLQEKGMKKKIRLFVDTET